MNNQNQTKVIIDAGHGGFDPGGGSNNFFKEKDKTLQISNYQKQRFDELGINSVLSRTTDETLNPTERIDRIYSLNPDTNDILISNHINNGASSGGEVIYSIRGVKNLPNLIANNLKSTGLPIRNVYTRIGRTGKDYYFILRNTVPNNAMIIEYGFASDKNDSDRILYSWNELAESVVKSIAEYLEVPYTPPKLTIYNVKNGDSLYKISNDFKVSIDSIKQANGLTSNDLQIGQTLIIPKQ